MFEFILKTITRARTVLECLHASVLYLQAFLHGMSIEDAENLLVEMPTSKAEEAEAKLILWWAPGAGARMDARWEADRARERRLAVFRGE